MHFANCAEFAAILFPISIANMFLNIENLRLFSSVEADIVLIK